VLANVKQCGDIDSLNSPEYDCITAPYHLTSTYGEAGYFILEGKKSTTKQILDGELVEKQ
jgi:hypothetical protein